MSFFEKLKALCTGCFTLNHPYHFPRPSRSTPERWETEQDGQLMNSLYWPKGNTTCSNEPLHYEWSWEKSRRRITECSNKTRKTP